MKKLRIQSEGTSATTHLTCMGEPVAGVREIEWKIDAATGVSEARIIVRGVEIDAEVELDRTQRLVQVVSPPGDR